MSVSSFATNGDAEDADLQPDVLPCRQQAHETAAQAAAVGRVEMAAQVLVDVGFDLCRFLLHRGESGVRFCLIKAVVGDAQDVKMRLQQRQHRRKIAFPVAAGTGQQHQGGACLVSQRIYLHDLLLFSLFVYANFMPQNGADRRFLPAPGLVIRSSSAERPRRAFRCGVSPTWAWPYPPACAWPQRHRPGNASRPRRASHGRKHTDGPAAFWP